MKFTIAILSCLFLSVCKNDRIRLNSIVDLNKHKSKFAIRDLKRNNFVIDYLRIYELSGLHFNREFVKNQYSFVIFFTDSVISTVDVLVFKNSGSASFMYNQLTEQINIARTVLGKYAHYNNVSVEVANFRIYNEVLRYDTLYLFGIDMPHEFFKCNDCSVISSGHLKNVDAICSALRN